MWIGCAATHGFEVAKRTQGPSSGVEILPTTSVAGPALRSMFAPPSRVLGYGVERGMPRSGPSWGMGYGHPAVAAGAQGYGVWGTGYGVWGMGYGVQPPWARLVGAIFFGALRAHRSTVRKKFLGTLRVQGRLQQSTLKHSHHC